jgi:hypothetical protein
MRCRTCGLTMTGMVDLPEDMPTDEIVFNLAWCQLDTEQGRKDLYRNLSIAQQKRPLGEKGN